MDFSDVRSMGTALKHAMENNMYALHNVCTEKHLKHSINIKVTGNNYTLCVATTSNAV